MECIARKIEAGKKFDWETKNVKIFETVKTVKGNNLQYLQYI